jgi:UDP-N-acetylmuramate--alanine ligase
MRTLPIDLGVIHFIGIGGIGMSGIAEVLHNQGYSVQGSDIADSANVARLRKLGIPVSIGHTGDNLGDAAVVVISSAVKSGNPELKTARERFLPIVRRAEMLGELMRLKWSVAIGGTHGKTTTTSLIAAMLEAADLDPTVINGGIINAWGTNARLGAGDWLVAEADESDGTFVKLPSMITVVTNIDREHMDHYGTFDKVREAFIDFVENIPFYGFAVLCLDDPEVQAIIPRVSDRKIVTYGHSPQADVRCVRMAPDANGTTFDVTITEPRTGATRTIAELRLPMHGAHNVQNACAAVAIADQLGLEEAAIHKALSEFGGVKRRFTRTGVTRGVTVIDDYGHHPVEIRAVLNAARAAAGTGRVIAVVQPHRYSRLHDLFEEFCTAFNNADAVIVADVYPAGEEPIEGADRPHLVEGLRAHGHRHVLSLDAPNQLAGLVAGVAESGDYVVCLGAGSITNWANALPDELEVIGEQVKEARG